jgi:hypothetical protein
MRGCFAATLCDRRPAAALLSGVRQAELPGQERDGLRPDPRGLCVVGARGVTALDVFNTLKFTPDGGTIDVLADIEDDAAKIPVRVVGVGGRGRTPARAAAPAARRGRRAAIGPQLQTRYQVLPA